MTADAFSMQSNGQSYSAKFDGKQYPVTGDPGNTQVVLKKIDDRTVEETDYRQGKVVDEIQIAAAADGKTVHADRQGRGARPDDDHDLRQAVRAKTGRRQPPRPAPRVRAVGQARRCGASGEQPAVDALAPLGLLRQQVSDQGPSAVEAANSNAWLPRSCDTTSAAPARCRICVARRGLDVTARMHGHGGDAAALDAIGERLDEPAFVLMRRTACRSTAGTAAARSRRAARRRGRARRCAVSSTRSVGKPSCTSRVRTRSASPKRLNTASNTALMFASLAVPRVTPLTADNCNAVCADPASSGNRHSRTTLPRCASVLGARGRVIRPRRPVGCTACQFVPAEAGRRTRTC